MEYCMRIDDHDRKFADYVYSAPEDINPDPKDFVIES